MLGFLHRTQPFRLQAKRPPLKSKQEEVQLRMNAKKANAASPGSAGVPPEVFGVSPKTSAALRRGTPYVPIDTRMIRLAFIVLWAFGGFVISLLFSVWSLEFGEQHYFRSDWMGNAFLDACAELPRMALYSLLLLGAFGILPGTGGKPSAMEVIRRWIIDPICPIHLRRAGGILLWTVCTAVITWAWRNSLLSDLIMRLLTKAPNETVFELILGLFRAVPYIGGLSALVLGLLGYLPGTKRELASKPQP